MRTAKELKKRVKRLERDLKEAHESLAKLGGEPATRSSFLPPPFKGGYLFKWQDRSIGWSGTKWALRYVALDRGRMSYYSSHLETQARYTLSLRGCAVSDEGWKRNRRHTSRKTPKGLDPPLEEVGAYFFVFSIYQRPDSADPGDTTDFVPLLRFSTPSLAEKTQWIQLLSEACAYSETDSFLAEEARRNAEEENRRQQQIAMASTMPHAEKGTLPALYFAPAKSKLNTVKRPSFSKLPQSKLFRTKSLSNDADKAEKKAFPPSKPVHRNAAPSFLSIEAPTQNYRGFFNLAIIILIVSNFRLVLASVQRHGFVLSDLPDLSKYSLETWDQSPFFTGMLMLQVFLVTGFLIEWALSKKGLSESVGMILHHINSHGSFVVCIFIVWNFIEKPAIGGCLLLFGTVTWMKLVSYALTNQDYRLSSNNKDEAPHHSTLAIIHNLDSDDWNIEYPRNITLGNLYYFWLAPTLTYQIAFPKTPRVRPMRVISIVVGILMSVSLFMFLWSQIVAPNLENLVKDLEASNGRLTYAILTEYWLRLCITNTYLWLLVFFIYFHLYLNLFAELLRFGDRVFYRDWWNSGEVSAYWRLWNLPVHYWLVRHLYFPCVRRNVPKLGATFIVFFLSAIMHEVLISIPFHMLRPWSFLGMMGQIPLVIITKYLYRKFPGSSIGNYLFWVSFCVVGQPMAILLYTIDYKYYKIYGGEPGFVETNQCRVAIGGTCLAK